VTPIDSDNEPSADKARVICVWQYELTGATTLSRPRTASWWS